MQLIFLYSSFNHDTPYSMCVFVMMSVVSFVYLCELYGKLVCVRAISIIKTIIIIENVQHISISYGHSCKGREGESGREM